jgi:hypothetical protein
MTYVQEVLSLNPGTVYWMDVSDASYYMKHTKITKIKVAEWGTPKKYFRKKREIEQPNFLHFRRTPLKSNLSSNQTTNANFFANK